MQRRFKQAFTALKEHGSVSYAKIATMGGLCDLDHTIVKATSPDDLPLPENYVNDLLKTFTISPSDFRAFSLSFMRRFGKTQCWRVALKCLVLLHRLIKSLPEDSPFRAELYWARTSGLLSLYPCHFRDSSSSCPADYTIFIRSYAQLLDEALDCLSLHASKLDEELEEDFDIPRSMSERMIEVDRLILLLPQLQSLIDRSIDCRPRGVAERSFLVQSTMKHIIRDSFVCYKSFRKHVVLVLENLMQMPYRSGVAAFGIYKKASIQANQLSEFYDWCKSMGLCGSYEYPFIDKIPKIQIQALETFLDGIWQLTESTSSTDSPVSDSTEDKIEKHEAKTKVVVSDTEEIEPLIKFEEVENNVSWEALLEASVSPANNLLSISTGHEHEYRYGYEDRNNLRDGLYGEENRWRIQLHNPHAPNPFLSAT